MSVTPLPETYTFPASFAQELLWHLDRATPGMTAYNSPRARRLRGPLDTAALGAALEALVQRHEILRTRYAERDGAVLQVVGPALPVPLPVTDVSALPAGERETEVRRLVGVEAQTPFDLGHAPPFRCSLVRLADDDHVLIVGTHHIATDGWSGAVMFRELFALYEGLRSGVPAELPELPIQYGDFAAWQREEMSGPRLEELLGYWRERLAGPLPVLNLPTDRPRPPAASLEGGIVGITVAPETIDGLRRLGQRHGASLYMVLLAAYQTLLARWSGQQDIMVGAPIAGRDRPETEGLIGFVANTMVYRSRLDADPTFDQLIDQVRDTCLGAYDHQEIPLEKLVMDLKASASLTDGSLFRAVFTMLDDTPAAQQLPSLAVEPFGRSTETSKYDLVLFLADRPESVQLGLNYRTDLFEQSTAIRFLGHLETLLTEAVRNPSLRIAALPILTAPETEALSRWNATALDLGPATTVMALIEAAGARAPGAAAVFSGGVTLTWEELLSRAHRLGHHLQSLGAGPEIPVGLCLERSADLIVGMTGILASGAAYVPLLPEVPAARLSQQCAESGVKLVVTDAAHEGSLPPDVTRVCLDRDAATLAAHPATAPGSGATAESLAYVLFTSGSTGVPKGVAVTHRNLVHYTRAISRTLELPLDRTGQAPWHFGTVSTLGADLGHTSVFPSLCSGGTLHVLPGDVILDATKFQAYVQAYPLDLLKITPSHFRALAGPEAAAEHLPTRWLVLGGEACPWDVVEQVLERGRCRVLNHYGPTEATVGACTLALNDTDTCRKQTPTVPIGRPLPNVTAHVLEPSGLPAPVGVPGELFIGGAGVARGYLHRDDLTRERFVARNGERLYRTGDRVRRLATGDIEFLGRLDLQVKIRGNRVELGEIEAVLERHPAVTQAAVILAGDLLVAYLMGTGLDDAALAAYVRTAVPDYMVPQAWVHLDQLPLNANGKVDRKALPVPSRGAVGASANGAPRSDTERALATLWAEILKKPVVGRDDDFMALGGHSLLAIRLMGRIAKQFGVRLPLRVLFEAGTVARLAEALEPRHPLEAPLAALWSEVLKRPVGREDDFGALGGHSLLAIRLMGRIAKQFGVRLPLRALVEHPTVAQLAAVIAAAQEPKAEPAAEPGTAAGAATHPSPATVAGAAPGAGPDGVLTPPLAAEVEEDDSPRTTIEAVLLDILRNLLPGIPVGNHQGFLAMGGTPELGQQVVRSLYEATGHRAPVEMLLADASVEEVTDYLLRTGYTEANPAIVAVQTQGTRRPFFLLHGDLTGGGFYCRGLADALGPEQPLYAIPPQTPHLADQILTIDGMAAVHLAAVRKVQPRGPYRLGGYCTGGLVAFEMARQLRQA
ncbi:MAG TPA: amino acid adenylation domain-containing protein, partial [Gemmatimonadales bacterium]|nr:amino acid adenylation domain-containing protein [Gemmatimonadales bacterium]